MEVRDSATLQPAKWGRWCERRKRERGRKRKRRRTRRRRRPHLPSKARWGANEGAQQRDPLTCQVGQVTRATEARAAGSELGGGGGEHTCQVRQGVGGAQGALGPAASEPTAGASARRTRRVWATAAGTTAVGCAARRLEQARAMLRGSRNTDNAAAPHRGLRERGNAAAQHSGLRS